MTEWILKTIDERARYLDVLARKFANGFPRGLIITVSMMAVFALLYTYDQTLYELVMATLSDAYLGVSIFIALTLSSFYAIDHYFSKGLLKRLEKAGKMQVPIAAFLGALPGCGGAIIVVTQYVNQKMSFGALVAVLISTMGDAAFLLISSKPDIALLVYGVSLLSGIAFGYLINFIHGDGFMRPTSVSEQPEDEKRARLPRLAKKCFLILVIPGSVLGILEAFQYDSNQLFASWSPINVTELCGILGALLCMWIWLSQPLDSWSARFSKKSERIDILETVTAETAFVSVWVIIGFLSYELFVHFSGLDIASLFTGLGAMVVLLAILIGFIPGCGPQILVTTLYINGVVPLSAQVANAISNDGDALFPAIALAKNAAIVATIYSAVPAVFIGYGFYFWA